VLERQVRVTLRDRAPLPGWARGRVTGAEDGVDNGTGDNRLHLATRVEGDPRVVCDGIRGEAPPSVRVTVEPDFY
jgi:hypothetical protein